MTLENIILVIIFALIAAAAISMVCCSKTYQQRHIANKKCIVPIENDIENQ
jgi:hypothetical protein